MLRYSKAKYNMGVYLPILYCIIILFLFRSDYSNANLLVHEFSGINLNLSSHINLNDIILYNLPEALWVFSLTLLSFNYSVALNKLKINFAYLPLAYVWIAEFFQLFKITNGTFDVLDILFSSITWAIAFFLLKSNKNQFNHITFSTKKLFLFVALFCSVFLADTSNF